jgi:hypothetical protein
MATYLYRTNSTSSNTYTFSAWVKHTTVGVNDYKTLCLFGTDQDVSSTMSLSINTTDKWNVYNGSSHNSSDAVARDPSGWYHVVLKVDNLSGTIYVNGESVLTGITCKATGTASNHMIVGAYAQSGNEDFWNGLMSHVAFVEGQALAPTVFGETDSTSGIWKFKSPSGVTWGTNGFHLKFENSGNLGLDSSGNGNNLTVSGNGRQALDTPSNVHATLNPLIINNFLASTIIYAETSEGNNTLTGTSTNNNGNGWSTLGANSGKWYCELKVTLKDGDYPYIGVAPEEMLFAPGSNYGVPGFQYTDTVSYNVGGTVRINSNISSFGDTYGLNDIIGIAMDLDNGAVYFSKNGVWQNSGDPTSGASKTGAALTFTANNKNYFFGASVFKTTNQVKFNFGNGYFGTTAITSAGSNGNGSLFEYNVPSGYYALNTKNINTYG